MPDKIKSRQNCCTVMSKNSAVLDNPSPQRPKSNNKTDEEEKTELFEVDAVGVKSLDIDVSVIRLRSGLYPW